MLKLAHLKNSKLSRVIENSLLGSQVSHPQNQASSVQTQGPIRGKAHTPQRSGACPLTGPLRIGHGPPQWTGADPLRGPLQGPLRVGCGPLQRPDEAPARNRAPYSAPIRSIFQCFKMFSGQRHTHFCYLQSHSRQKQIKGR